jgi:hypothetical protein
MNPAASVTENLFINGRFLRGLWGRLEAASEDSMACPIWAQTFAADRWSVRYATALGEGVFQTRSGEVPTEGVAENSLEIRGSAGVVSEVLVGQNLEAAEAPNYRRCLRLSAWVFAQHPSEESCAVAPVFGSPVEDNLFDRTAQTVLRLEKVNVPVNRWERIEWEVDATAFRSTGLRVELAFSPQFFSRADALVRLTDLRFFRDGASVCDRPPMQERQLASRFFQRHDARSVNAIGRVFAVNAHELYFLFNFPEMRVFPDCTIFQDNADLTVFSLAGVPQSGFSYDVAHGARTSIVIRATRQNHGLSDGYLAFQGFRGAILLDAEL